MLTTIRLAASAAVSAVLLGTVAPAYAQEVVHRDRTGDVAKVLRNGTFLADPAITYPDIVRTRLAHRANDLVVRMSFRDLRPRGEVPFYDVTAELPDGRRRFFAWSASAGERAGGELITNVRGECDARISIDYRRDVVRMAVPRTCVGSPRWVRLAAEASLTFHNGTDLYDAATRGRMTNLRQGPFSRRLSVD